MKPADLRNLTWQTVQPLLNGQRLAVLQAWRAHGPGTTEHIALRAGISLLNVRPRTTELYQLGLLVLAGRNGTEGIYRAVPEAECHAAFERARAAATGTGEQIYLNLF
jgi:hypothetical protein